MTTPLIWDISPHADTRRLIGLNLSKRGFHVLEASSHHDLVPPSARPHLIILDVELPDESDWDVVRDLRSSPQLQRIPLILLVGEVPATSRLDPFRPVQWVAKPAAIDTLLAVVQKSLTEQSRRYEMNRPAETLADRVRAIPGGEHLYMCYSCGTCVANCMVQKVDLTYNPRRLIQKVINGMEAEAFEDKTSWLCSACDLCYPSCPQKIHVSGVLWAVRDLAIQAGHTTTLQPAVVDESTCVACGLCTEVCPYEAIALVERQIAGRKHTVASVDQNRCMACGLCAASCRSASIELPDEFSNEALIDELWEWMQGGRAEPIPVERVEWVEAVSGPGVEAVE